MYAITATLNVSPILISKIATINTVQDVKNISQEIKSAIHKKNTNMKNANRKEVRKLTIQNRDLETKQVKINTLVQYLTSIGLEPNQQPYFIEQYTVYNKPINAIKKEANNYYVKLFKEYRQQQLPRLVELLKQFELNGSNIEHIMNKYTKTYIQPNVLLQEAKMINNMRVHERWVEVEEELIEYLDRLPLKPDNRRKITTALEGYFVNFRPLKKSATNMPLKQRMNLVPSEEKNS